MLLKKKCNTRKICQPKKNGSFGLDLPDQNKPRQSFPHQLRHKNFIFQDLKMVFYSLIDG